MSVAVCLRAFVCGCVRASVCCACLAVRVFARRQPVVTFFHCCVPASSQASAMRFSVIARLHAFVCCRVGPTQCSVFGKRVFVFGVVFGVRFLNMFGLLFGTERVRSSAYVLLCSVFRTRDQGPGPGPGTCLLYTSDAADE